MDLSELYTISMVRKLPNNSDGRVIDEHTIHISSRLYRQLPTLDIQELHDNDIFRTIVKTLFHELCHINEISKMPNLHKNFFLHTGTICDVMVIQFWVEYIAETKTCTTFHQNMDEFCEGIANSKWDIIKVNSIDNDCQNYYYLVKLLAYVIPRVQETSCIDTYLKSIYNPIVKNMVFELNNEVSRLNTLYPFDGIEPLEEIHKLFIKYWLFFIGQTPFINAVPDD